ncbi:hypothetical protein VTL71DRAFT_2123 [Oculimacula yallundae]|uniref:Heterokaryon incompatibility domain-containing protein n=1 Tax=Oculimacula yallundae TaxID=86028 RepID=A0ABR4C7Y7_9HELO
MSTSQSDGGVSRPMTEPSTILSPNDEHIPVSSLVTRQSFDNTVHSEPASEDDSLDMSDVLSNISDMCAYCQNIYAHWPSPGEERAEKLRFEHHEERSSILESADRGCSLCSQFAININSTSWVKRIDDHWVYEGVPGCKFPASSATNGTVLFVQPRSIPRHENDAWHINLFISVVNEAYDNSFKTVAKVGISGNVLEYAVNAHHSKIVVIRISEPGTCHSTLVYKLRPMLHTGSISRATSSDGIRLATTKDALPLAKAWLLTCQDEHESCGHSSNATFAPTRLVDVSGSKPRLHIVDPAESDIQYATLSHCWGLTSYTRLKRSNLQQFQHTIPTEAISTSFQHAMSITNYLGLHYIWIDSLCIIQDSVEDWRKEAGLMSSVYGGSAINIAAAGAEDGAGGCFTTRRSSWICRLKITSIGVSSYFMCVPAEFYLRLLDDMPLMKRAWALQERILPSRSLCFTKSQLFWECNELHACETFPAGYNFQYGEPTFLDFNDDLSVLEKWSSIVSSYSARSLTLRKDKLVAISGLAKIFQERTQYTYIAGLWRSGLESQLCWFVASSQELSARPIKYRAPT